MHKKVKEFILKNENLINDSAWDELYKIAEKELDSWTGFLTDALHGADIHPLEELSYVPEAFAFGSITPKFNIPEGIKTISADAFGDCTAIEITLPQSLEIIDIEAFAACNGLTTITIPDNVDTIGSGAFDGCNKLKSVNIPSKLKIIESATFNLCSALTDVDTYNADSLERIEDRAFQGCANLDELYIPPSVTYIHNKALPDHTDILCKEGSYAHEYAVAKDRHFKLV